MKQTAMKAAIHSALFSAPDENAIAFDDVARVPAAPQNVRRAGQVRP